jgi:hypothetical protein
MEGFFSCPECGFENPQGSATCKRCLLVFEKYERKANKVHHIVNASNKLENAWRDLLVDYSAVDKHEKFINQAIAEKNLPFASQQYRKMIELNPADDISPKMIEKIIQVATYTYLPPVRQAPPPKSSHLGVKLFIFAMLFMLAVIVGQLMFRK